MLSELLLSMGAALAWLFIGILASAIIYYPFDRSRNNATLKEYLKENL